MRQTRACGELFECAKANSNVGTCTVDLDLHRGGVDLRIFDPARQIGPKIKEFHLFQAFSTISKFCIQAFGKSLNDFRGTWKWCRCLAGICCTKK